LQANNETVSDLSAARILVTGGTGFVGRAVAHMLRAEGSDPLVTCFNQKPQGSADFAKLDLVDAEQTNDLVLSCRPQIVFHLAGVTGNADPTGRIYDDVNFTGTVNLLTALEKVGVERVILLGSAAEYGNQHTPFTEDAPTKPVSAYAISKARANQFALNMHATSEFPVTVLRVFTAYGYGQPHKMFLPQLLRYALLTQHFKMSDGRQRRDFVHIDDVTSAAKAAVTAENVSGRVLNVASGHAVALRDVAMKAWDLCGADKALLEIGALQKSGDDSFDTEGDVSFAREVLNWCPGPGILDEDDDFSRLKNMIRRMKSDIQISAGR